MPLVLPGVARPYTDQETQLFLENFPLFPGGAVTTALIALVAALTLVFSPIRVLAALLLLSLLVLNPVPTFITLMFVGFFYYLLKR